MRPRLGAEHVVFCHVHDHRDEVLQIFSRAAIIKVKVTLCVEDNSWRFLRCQADG